MAIDTLGANALASDSVTTAKIDDDAITYPQTTFVDSATGAQTLPKGTTAQRPGSPADGMVRFNTTTSVTEEYRSSAWKTLSNVTTVGGGTETTSGGYTIHTFTSSGTFTVEGSAKTGVDYLVVAGGGGGGSTRAGGGGGGGMVNATNQTIGVGTHTITIGAGGAGNTGTSGEGTQGGNTIFGSIQTCIGGGYGGGEGVAGGVGGSGGGGSDGGGGGGGTSGQGNNGGASDGSSGGGGGGGKGGVGEAGGTDGSQQGGDGGAGLTLDYRGSNGP